MVSYTYNIYIDMVCLGVSPKQAKSDLCIDNTVEVLVQGRTFISYQGNSIDIYVPDSFKGLQIQPIFLIFTKSCLLTYSEGLQSYMRVRVDNPFHDGAQTFLRAIWGIGHSVTDVHYFRPFFTCVFLVCSFFCKFRRKICGQLMALASTPSTNVRGVHNWIS